MRKYAIDQQPVVAWLPLNGRPPFSFQRDSDHVRTLSITTDFGSQPKGINADLAAAHEKAPPHDRFTVVSRGLCPP
jgi:hypothetical protein